MSRTRLVRFYLVVYYQGAAASNLKKQTCLPVTLLKPEATACVLLLYTFKKLQQVTDAELFLTSLTFPLLTSSFVPPASSEHHLIFVCAPCVFLSSSPLPGASAA